MHICLYRIYISVAVIFYFFSKLEKMGKLCGTVVS